MATIEVPAEFVGYLKSAAVYTLAEEACRVRDGERKVWEAEGGGLPEKVALAQDDLGNVRPYLDRAIPMAREILALPVGEDATIEDEPELTYYVLHNMACKVLAPQIHAMSDYLPIPEVVPLMADAMRWAATESLRLEADRVGRREEAVA